MFEQEFGWVFDIKDGQKLYTIGSYESVFWAPFNRINTEILKHLKVD